MNRSFKLLLLSSYFNTVAFGILSPLYALFVVKIGGQGFHAGLSWSIYALSAGVIMLGLSRFVNHWQRWWKMMIIAGFLILAGASFLYLIIDSLLLLYLVQAIFALGVSLVMPTLKLMYTKIEDPGREAEEWALLDGGTFIILGVAAFVGGWLFSIFGFSAIFVAMSVTQLVAALLAFTSLRKIRIS